MNQGRPIASAEPGTLTWAVRISPSIYGARRRVLSGAVPSPRIDPRDGEREVVFARWGLIPFWMKEKPKVPHINARAEPVHKLPLFREAFAKRRCLIPATGFYEWQAREDDKQPYRFQASDRKCERSGLTRRSGF
jgi:putative SOS response-associated peptidase YedK